MRLPGRNGGAERFPGRGGNGGFQPSLKEYQGRCARRNSLPNDRVSTKEKGVFINISLKVDSRKNWEEIAQEVQKRVANMIREWGFPLEGVNVEVSEVEWFLE